MWHRHEMGSPATQREFGRYQLLSTLARGGMAELLLARLVGVGGFAKVVAIKRMLPHLSEDPGFVDMFLNEGRIAARMSHPNVCQVYELGEVDGQLYLAMEYLEGLSWEDLTPLFPRGHGFELRITAGVLGQACDGLHYAHSLTDADGQPTPIVHRDVSPQNLFVTTEGICKVLDFGVSKVLTEGPRTRTGMIKGKLPYMAPEQIRGEAVDPRADVFSAGVVLWEALTGERLFVRDSDYQIWKAVTEEEIPLVTAKVRGLPPAIDGVVMRALARDPERRYPTIRALAQDLRQVANALGGPLDPPEIAEAIRSMAAVALAERAKKVNAALGSGPRSSAPRLEDARAEPPDPAVTDPGTTQQEIPQTEAEISMVLRDESIAIARRPEPRRGRRWPLAMVLGLLVLVGGVTVWAVTRGREAKKQPAAPTATAPAITVGSGGGFELGGAGGIRYNADGGATLGDPKTGISFAGGGSGIGSGSGSGSAGAAGSGVVEKRKKDRKKTGGDTSELIDPATPSAPAEPGLYSVDSKPYATIYIDGKKIDTTPVFKVKLAPGSHTVKAVREDGTEQRFSVTIESGEHLSSGVLKW
jgi:serine/threonine protein kinase